MRADVGPGGKSLSMLNFGQALIVTLGLLILIVISTKQVVDGSLTVGGLVGLNAIMLQLILPLNFLGTVYREIRQALVDMADLFILFGENTEEDEIEKDEGPGALVTSSKDPKFFSNGLDLDWMQNPEDYPESGDREVFGEEFMYLMGRIITLPIPSICVVNGHAFGAGFMLALSHDIRSVSYTHLTLPTKRIV